MKCVDFYSKVTVSRQVQIRNRVTERWDNRQQLRVYARVQEKNRTKKWQKGKETLNFVYIHMI